MRQRLHICLATCLLVLGLLVPQVALAEKYALLIGISDYRGTPFASLPGPLNDVVLMRQVLLERFQFKPHNILALVDNRATHRRILDELAKLARRVQPGDMVYIHYSGHGSKACDLNGDEGGKGLDSTLVTHGSRQGLAQNVALCADLAVFATGDEPEALVDLNHYDILDDELERALSSLSARAGQTVFVADTCYSGTITRDEVLPPRTGPIDYRLHPEGRKPSLPAGSLRRWIAIGAAEDTEKAMEWKDEEGIPYGAFTYFWAKALMESVEAKTWHDVLLRTKAHMQKAKLTQNPKFEGEAGNLFTPTPLSPFQQTPLQQKGPSVSPEQAQESVRSIRQNAEIPSAAELFLQGFVSGKTFAARQYRAKRERQPIKIGFDSRKSVARVYGFMSMYYGSIGDFVSHKSYAEKSLEILKESYGRNHPLTAEGYARLGGVFQNLGDYGEAIALHRTALSIFLETLGKEHLRTGQAYFDMARVMVDAEQWEEALTACSQALDIWDELEKSGALNKRGHEELISIINFAGQINAYAGEHEQALEWFNEALGRAYDNLEEDNNLIISLYHNIALLELKLQNFDEALSCMIYAFRHIGSGHATIDFCTVASHLGEIYRKMGNLEVAIYYGKEAVHSFQSLRAGQVALPQVLQDSFVNTKKSQYLKLADMLAERGRLVEAQHVLSMLKQEELYDFLVRSPEVEKTLLPMEWLPQEAVVHKKMSAFFEQQRQLEGQIKIFQEKESSTGLSDEEYSYVFECSEQARAIDSQLFAWIESVPAELASLNPQKSDAALKAQLSLRRHIQPLLAHLEPGTALLHTIMAEDSLWIMVTTSAHELPVARQSLISYAELSLMIRDFRQMVVDRKQDPRPLAQKLYRLLIGPVQDILDAEKAHTLLLSLDGPLRYLSPAALHDGKQWLVEKYAISLFTDASSLGARRTTTWSAAGFGVTQAHGEFSPLPGVEDELRAIIRSSPRSRAPLEGEVLLDTGFTSRNLAKLLTKRHPVVHVATHFSFKPGTVEDSFLLLGDGSRLTLQDLADNAYPFAGVEQLTLSSCNTAMTASLAGSEIEGLAALAQRKGAQSVLATLWPVADASTGAIMARFYAEKKPHVSRAKALQTAQLACIRNALTFSNKKKGTPPLTDTVQHKAFPVNDTSHPYFWAPFVLLGDWR